ncbi:MAG TPA: hypothetical protein VKA78_03795, partial [Pyrinomonadaceae bacterium]|nr:hypothetical protein [Pyrinomonadaceae bacterium]
MNSESDGQVLRGLAGLLEIRFDLRDHVPNPLFRIGLAEPAARSDYLGQISAIRRGRFAAIAEICRKQPGKFLPRGTAVGAHVLGR